MNDKEPDMAKLISRALTNGDFYPVLQPFVNIKTQTIHGIEVLARWGDIPPLKFFKYANKLCIEHKISLLVLKKALEQLNTPIPVNFNLSPYQISQKNTVLLLTELLRSTDYPCNLLTLEITESPCPLGREKITIDHIHQIAEMGINISLDDFGVEQQNFVRLIQLPVNQIKIDQVFTKEIDRDKCKQDVVKHLLMLAQEQQLEVIIEGVETESESLCLKNIGGNIQQGFYHYPPLSVTNFNRLYTEMTQSIQRFTFNSNTLKSGILTK